MRKLEQVTREVVSWLTEIRIGYALIGGLAVSFRTIERFTKDIDLVIAVGVAAVPDIGRGGDV